MILTANMKQFPVNWGVHLKRGIGDVKWGLLNLSKEKGHIQFLEGLNINS